MKRAYQSLIFFSRNQVLEAFLLDQSKCSVSTKPKHVIAIWTFSNRRRKNTEIKFVPKCHFEQREKFLSLELLKQTF